jgi:hypothetical protein
VPKKRAELRYDARPMLNAISRSEAETIALFTKYLGVLSYWPKIVVILSPPGRLRLPARDVVSKEIYRESHSGRWDNRTSPGRVVLNGKWEVVDPAAPDYLDLLHLDQDQMRYRGVTTKGGSLKVYTFQIVSSLEEAQRQQGHVLANYDSQRQQLAVQLEQAQEKFNQARSGVVELPSAERRRLIDLILHHHNRLMDIDQIYDERLQRAAGLKELIIFSSAQLQALAASVRELGLRLPYPDECPRTSQMVSELQRLEDKITFFKTSDMKERTRKAGVLIHQVKNGMDGTLDPVEAGSRLVAAASLTEEASDILTQMGKRLTEKAEV